MPKAKQAPAPSPAQQVDAVQAAIPHWITAITEVTAKEIGAQPAVVVLMELHGRGIFGSNVEPDAMRQLLLKMATMAPDDEGGRTVPPPEGEPEHKRFLLFAFDHYYPAGGIFDVDDSFDTIEEAQASAALCRNDQVTIFDCETRTEVPVPTRKLR